MIRARLSARPGRAGGAIQLACNKIDPEVEESADGRRADALTYLAEHFLGSPEAAPAKADDHHQVVVHVSAETLSERLDVPEPDGGMSGAEIEDSGAISAQAARRISWRFRGDSPGGVKGRTAGLGPQAPPRLPSPQASAQEPRRRLPVPGLHPHALGGTPTTSGTGRTAARPSSTTSCCCTAATTA